MSQDKKEEEWVNADPQQITLEHILPKTFPETGWENFDAETHTEYKTRLGNLCLLKRSENNGMSNDSFAAKKPFFANSSFNTTSELSEHDDCSPQQLESRQRKLAKLALLTWPAT